MTRIDELRAAVHADPRGVAEATVALLGPARSTGDPAEVSRILSVLGRARRSLGEIALAEANFAEAIVLAMRAGEDDVAADAHIGQAGVLSFAGRSAEAFAHLDEAHRLGGDRTRAYASLQRAIIEQRIGHMRQALSRYEAALPTLRELGLSVDVALVLMNRGVIRLQSGSLSQALADLAEARALFQREGHDFGVAQAEHNLGWACARSGDLPRSLRYLDRAAERFHALGHEALEVEVDRVEVLLAAGLCAEAAELAADTATRLSAGGNHSQAAETWLLGARAAALDGDRQAAAAHAERARCLFASQGATGWERAARLETILSGDVAADAETLRALAAELEEVGNARGGAAAVALACLAACRDGDTGMAHALAVECAARAQRLGVLEIRLLSRHAAATYSFAIGDDRAARGHVLAGLTDLHRHQASLAATDARAAVAVHAADLARLGLRLGLRTGSPMAVLAWMERARGGAFAAAAPRPPADEVLAAELTRLRAVVARLRSPEAGGDQDELLQAQADLERAIRRRWLRTSRAVDLETGQRRVRARLPSAGQLRWALGEATLVSVSEVDGHLIAVTVPGAGAPAGSGPVRLTDLGTAADAYAAAETVATMLRARVTGPAVAGGPNPQLGTALDLLDRTLAGAAAGRGPLVLVVPAAWHTLAWHLVPCLAGRPICVAPSVSWWYDSSTAGRRPHQPNPRALVVAGPRLAEADAEAKAVGAWYEPARVLTAAAATCAAVLAELGEADVAHLACHARIRHDNALWSSLELADGPLFVYDLERLGRTPPVVVLSGCETGVGVRAGEELLGLTTALLARGTRSLIAAISTMPDNADTRDTMTALHEYLHSGLSPAAALARLSSGRLRTSNPPLPAYLTCFGT